MSKGVGEKPTFPGPNPARYDAALELCPQHKEGLVGRGAALTNLGKAREVRDGSVAWGKMGGGQLVDVGLNQQPDGFFDSALVVGLYGGFRK